MIRLRFHPTRDDSRFIGVAWDRSYLILGLWWWEAWAYRRRIRY